MKNILLLLMIAVMIAGVVAWPAAASACSCIEPPGVAEELERSDAVFSGKAILVDEKPVLFSAATRSVVFQVAQVWKGPAHSQIKIKTGQGDGDCGINFSAGQEYLVYAVKSEMYGANELTTIICDRTAVLSQSQGDFAVLGEGQEPTEEVDLLGRNGWLLPLAGFIVFGIIAFTVYRKRKTIK
ncbi:hypothetical protein [Planococcus halotolerans]|uniref:Tissue inhibitor of metalloproteinase n=1 Tax=Planococcus halotolerans TaxID=2233542 RepID=A0A365KQP6_9BACL|nr:hypothetical protein [Planococcus halotolerans]QHJ69547.1 hypothetical protein DNR44_002380 [Planococcus halotolerans]RAZ75496.1 hypothetical protein DP120_14090 [Planococcus halotolerans]